MIVCVLNGYHDVVSRDTPDVTVQECGCAYHDWPHRWHQMCKPHCTETEELHTRAGVEHDKATFIKELTS